ncbi:Colanic acid biosynthesis glycosyl transferase WcaA [Cronobacter condimenti 1330]|uniref:Colanic acid biosynthesis glycosyl transferase WcaA n=1 Tax=Cronobacter condimenti 1330 TaxID=1073999 RepID=K8A1R8_9ENTR|nr:Colanic acid biosynthesis glycosyl transferase WcaA [Cronobacter condimenti 1330]
MTSTARPLVSVYMPTWNRQQLAIRAINSVLRQDYDNWELIIVDDCSSNWEQLQSFVLALNDPRVSYTRNDFNSGACAVRNQAILQAKGDFITGIDDDDEWMPNRLSVFLSHKEKLNHHAFLYANDYLCEGQVYSQPNSLPSTRNRRGRSFSLNATSSATRFSPGPGALKSRCLITNSPPPRTMTCSCAWWPTASRGKWKTRRKFCTSITVKCRLRNRRKNLQAISTSTANTKINSTAPAKNISSLRSIRSVISATGARCLYCRCVIPNVWPTACGGNNAA